jgi:hypothetical protein
MGRMVTILRLTHSADFDDGVPEEYRGTAVAQRTFEEITGLEATTVAKNAWPAPELPGILDRWLERTQPDIVFIAVRGYAFTYESVPVKLERKLKFGGRQLARAGLGAAPRFEQYRAFQLLQRAAQKTIGGEAFFTPAEVLERMIECARRVLAKESTVLTICGPTSWFTMYESGARRRAEPKVAWVDRELRVFCEKLGVHYLSLDAVPGVNADASEYLPNRLHGTAKVHAARGEAEGRAMATAWQLAHSDRGFAVQRATTSAV